jgi:hypothetical protein
MSVDEIEAAIRSLGAEEFARIAERFHALEQERWDAEMDRDASSGRLDFLISEAAEDREQGRLIDWPPPIQLIRVLGACNAKGTVWVSRFSIPGHSSREHVAADFELSG